MCIKFFVLSLAAGSMFVCNLYGQMSAISKFSGSFESTNQWYIKDTVIGSIPPANRIASNNYLKLDYTSGIFFAGLQYEAYLPPLVGFSPQLEGNKLTNRFFGIRKKTFAITVGNFYEQFGTGMLLRFYEDRQLGINNALDGVNFLFTPYDFLSVKVLYGKQRNNLVTGEPVVRGADVQMDVLQLFNKKSDNNLTIGGSWVNKFQEYTGPLENFPTDVNAYSARLEINSEVQNIRLEYAEKLSDPNFSNLFSLRKGRAFLFNHSFNIHRLGFNITLRRLENMDFRSDRNASENNFMINYLPANCRQHKYSLANIYSYSTQSANEVGGQAELYYHFANGSFLGGQHGANLTANFSMYHRLDTVATPKPESFNLSFINTKENLFRDINIEFEKIWTSSFKTIIGYIGLNYNKTAIEGNHSEYVKSHIFVGDFNWSVNEKNAVRFEVQHLFTKQDKKNWIAGLVEYSYAPKWSIFISDQYNYGNIKKIHYYTAGMSYSHESATIALRYGRQREGIICAGGICKMMPASSGLTLSLNISF